MHTVSIGERPKGSAGQLFLGLATFAGLVPVAAIVDAVRGIQDGTSSSLVGGFCWAAIGVAALVFFVNLYRQELRKPDATYGVRLTTSPGEFFKLDSPNRDEIERVAAAILEAISAQRELA